MYILLPSQEAAPRHKLVLQHIYNDKGTSSKPLVAMGPCNSFVCMTDCKVLWPQFSWWKGLGTLELLCASSRERIQPYVFISHDCCACRTRNRRQCPQTLSSREVGSGNETMCVCVCSRWCTTTKSLVLVITVVTWDMKLQTAWQEQ